MFLPAYVSNSFLLCGYITTTTTTWPHCQPFCFSTGGMLQSQQQNRVCVGNPKPQTFNRGKGGNQGSTKGTVFETLGIETLGIFSHCESPLQCFKLPGEIFGLFWVNS